MEAVRQVFEDLQPKLNISSYHPTVNLLPTDVNYYLMANPLRFCLLVLDARIVKDAFSYLHTQRIEYETLLQTAAKNVGKIPNSFLRPGIKRLAVRALYKPFDENI